MEAAGTKEAPPTGASLNIRLSNPREEALFRAENIEYLKPTKALWENLSTHIYGLSLPRLFKSPFWCFPVIKPASK